MGIKGFLSRMESKELLMEERCEIQTNELLYQYLGCVTMFEAGNSWSAFDMCFVLLKSKLHDPCCSGMFTICNKPGMHQPEMCE